MVTLVNMTFPWILRFPRLLMLASEPQLPSLHAPKPMVNSEMLMWISESSSMCLLHSKFPSRVYVYFPLDIFGWKMSFSFAESGTTTYSLPICRCIAGPNRDLGKTHRLTVLLIINSVNLRPGRRCHRKCVHGVF